MAENHRRYAPEESAVFARQPIRVLVVGPRPGSKGGVGQLMSILEHSANRAQEKLECKFLDPGSTGTGRRRLVDFLSAAMLITIASRRDTHLVHFNLASRGSTIRKVVLSWLCRTRGLPYVIHLHGAEYPDFLQRQSRLARCLISKFFQCAERTIVLGEYWRTFVSEQLSVSGARVTVLPNAAVGPREVPERNGPIRILFLGRLTARKGIEALLAVLADLPESPPWSAVLAGDGDVAGVKNYLRTRGISNVEVPGWLSSKGVESEQAACQVFVLPSRAEGLPVAVLQAMAWGQAIVTTPVGSIPDVLSEGRTALMVPVDDVDSLRDALLRLINDTDLRRTLGNAARTEWATHYAPDPWAERLRRAYVEALGLLE